ncbi:MAG: polyprenyl synthetase family protein [Chitinophagaceae bacterium]|nr:polyprenyl synthetase family protein [Chitinophagaceae bacterium]
MFSFEQISEEFARKFNVRHFPETPASLYEPAEYFLGIGGKRLRPAMCLMANELFGTINPDAYHVAIAIELFHNFTLIHDDIMDKAPLRRNMATVHTKYGESTALLTGDAMIVKAYEYLNRVNPLQIQRVIFHFNNAARQVCEGQQLDMDFEKKEHVNFDEYITMIELKTSVLLAASLRLGAILGGAGKGNQDHLYEFGRNLGIAFQVQDDYLDAFGDPARFGKQVGGDIKANKKTFLVIHALESCGDPKREEFKQLMKSNAADKVERVLAFFRECGVDTWAAGLKEKYISQAEFHLEEVAVSSARKDSLRNLVRFLIQRDH